MVHTVRFCEILPAVKTPTDTETSQYKYTTYAQFRGGIISDSHVCFRKTNNASGTEKVKLSRQLCILQQPHQMGNHPLAPALLTAVADT